MAAKYKLVLRPANSIRIGGSIFLSAALLGGYNIPHCALLAL
jgi:hypothetical protein